MKWLVLDFQGRKVRVPALKHAGRLWFHWQGQTHVLEVPTAGRRTSSEKVSAHPGVIKAPMPGKVTRVMVQLGAKVQKGQTLIVMEAMKMEYTLAADQDGQVTQVAVQAGAQVGLGDVLVQVGAT